MKFILENYGAISAIALGIWHSVWLHKASIAALNEYARANGGLLRVARDFFWTPTVRDSSTVQPTITPFVPSLVNALQTKAMVDAAVHPLSATVNAGTEKSTGVAPVVQPPLSVQ